MIVCSCVSPRRAAATSKVM